MLVWQLFLKSWESEIFDFLNIWCNVFVFDFRLFEFDHDTKNFKVWRVVVFKTIIVEMHHLRGATTYLALFCAISCFLKHCFFNLVEIGMSSLETHLWFDQLLKISAPSGFRQPADIIGCYGRSSTRGTRAIKKWKKNTKIQK